MAYARSLTLSALLCSLVPTPHRAPEAPSRPTKGLGSDFAFGLLPLSRLRESGSRLGQPGSASGSIQCVQACRSPAPGKCAFGNVSKSRKVSAPGPGGIEWGGANAAGLVGPIWQRSDVQRGGGRQGGGSRRRSRRRPRAPSAQHAPLKDAGVLATQRDEMRVVVREPDTGHVAAVATVHEAWRLGWGKGRVAAGAAQPRAPLSRPAPAPAPGARGVLTLARAHGYWKRCTLQKSSATATTRSLWERHRELMSVPSEPSGHTPSTVAGLSLASSPPPPTAQSPTVSGFWLPDRFWFLAPAAAAATHPLRSWHSFPRESPRGLQGWICQYLHAHLSTHTQHSHPGAGSTL